MQSLMLIIHVALAVGVIGLVLIQHGKGADAGAAFGSGASSTVFGSRGSASFMTRLTTILAALFFVTSLVLFYLAANRDRGTSSVTDSLPSSVPTAVQESVDTTEPEESDLPQTAPPADSTTDPTSSDSDMPAMQNEAVEGESGQNDATSSSATTDSDAADDEATDGTSTEGSQDGTPAKTTDN